jgi:hypothetical protein
VGVTRAQDTLTLTSAKTRMKWGKSQPSIPSRFLAEMQGLSEKAARAAEAAARVHAPRAAKQPVPAERATPSLAHRPRSKTSLIRAALQRKKARTRGTPSS